MPAVTYCDIYDIKAELKRLTISSTSVPSEADVEKYIEQISAEMNATFAAAGVLPVVDDEALLVAEQIAVYGVAAKTLRAAEFEPEREKRYQDLYEARLKMVLNNPSMMESASEVDVAGPSGMDAGTGENRKFRREEKDW